MYCKYVQMEITKESEYKARTPFTTTFEYSLIQEFKKVALREGKPVNRILKELMKDYIAKHGDGNPIYTLDKFQDPDFKICPAFFSNHDRWIKYFKSLNHDEKLKYEVQFGMVAHAYNKSD